MKRFSKVILILCFEFVILSFKLQSQNNFSFSYINGNSTHHYNLINKAKNVVMCENVLVNYTALGENKFNSIYQYTRTQTPNPFSVQVPHSINVTTNQIEVSPISIMDPMICRFNPDNSSLSYNGTSLIYPTKMQVGQLLPDANGTAIISGQNGFSISINIQIKDRQLLNVKDVIINGQNKQVFTFTNKLHYEVISQGITIHNVDETVKNEIILGGGLYSMDRNSPFGSSFLQLIN